MAKTFAQIIEWASSRGVGQFHLFDRELRYQQTWRSYDVAKTTAAKNGWTIFNDSGDKVA